MLPEWAQHKLATVCHIAGQIYCTRLSLNGGHVPEEEFNLIALEARQLYDAVVEHCWEVPNGDP
jgi:hypothetical protein